MRVRLERCGNLRQLVQATPNQRNYVLQASILLLQYAYGPRCIIPKVGTHCQSPGLEHLPDSLALPSQHAGSMNPSPPPLLSRAQRFLPPRYDYHRPLPVSRHDCSVCDIETGDSGRECVICMSPVDVAAASQRMLTPCDHCFHSTCLERWLAVSMTCPTCRKPLPPP